MITNTAPSRPLPQPAIALPATLVAPVSPPPDDADDDGIHCGLVAEQQPTEDENDCSWPVDSMSREQEFPSGFGREGAQGVPVTMLVKMQTVPMRPEPAHSDEPDSTESVPGQVDEAVYAQVEMVMDRLGMSFHAPQTDDKRAVDLRSEAYLQKLDEFDDVLRALDVMVRTEARPIRLSNLKVPLLELATCVSTHPAGWAHRKTQHWEVGTRIKEFCKQEGLALPLTQDGKGKADHGLSDITAPPQCWTDPEFVHQLAVNATRSDVTGAQARKHLLCMDLLNWMQPGSSDSKPRDARAIARELVLHFDRAVSTYFGLVKKLEDGVDNALAAENAGTHASQAWLSTQPQEAQTLAHELAAWSLVVRQFEDPNVLALTSYGRYCPAGQLDEICAAFQLASQRVQIKIDDLAHRVQTAVSEVRHHQSPLQEMQQGIPPEMDLDGRDSAGVLAQLEGRMPAILANRLMLGAREIQNIDDRLHNWIRKLDDHFLQPDFNAKSCKNGFDQLLMMYQRACARYQRAWDAQRAWTCEVLADRVAMRTHLSPALTEEDCQRLEAARDVRLIQMDVARQVIGERPRWMLERYAEVQHKVEMTEVMRRLAREAAQKPSPSMPSDGKKSLAETGQRESLPSRPPRERVARQTPPSSDFESKAAPESDNRWFEPSAVDTEGRSQRHLDSLMRKDTKDGVMPSKRQSDIPSWLGFEFIDPPRGSPSSSSSSSSSSSASSSSGSSGSSGTRSALAEIARLRAELPEVMLTRVPDVQALFAQWGYSERPGKGDHINFHKPHARTFTLVATQGSQQLEPLDAQRVKKHLYNNG